MIKIVTNSTKNEIAETLLSCIEDYHLQLRSLNSDLEFEFGDDLLSQTIGATKNDKTCYLTLRDRYGRMLTELISKSLVIIKELKIDEHEFRNSLDSIFASPKIYDGEFISWSSVTPTVESMEIDQHYKYWWRRNKAK